MAQQAQQVMLAHKFDDSIDPTNWWMSEKLDGVRAYWSGSHFYSREGNEFIAPEFFKRDLPKEPLDGELWCGRGLFSKTISIIKKSKDPEKYAEDWKYVTYLVFDAPGRSDRGMGYEARVKWLQDNIQPKKESTYAAVVGVCKCTGKSHLDKMLKQVLLKGGEGIMLRKPGSSYEHGRSHVLLKVKFFHDEEALVKSHENGSGRCQNMMGKIHVVLPNGTPFKIGTGFSDAQRRNPPKIGSVVSFKFQELSDHGHPRFPVFLRVREDVTWADVLARAKVTPPFSSVKMKKTAPVLGRQHSILFSLVPSRQEGTGKKIVTSNDVDEIAQEEAANLLTTAPAGMAAVVDAGAGAAAAAAEPASRKRGAAGAVPTAAGGKRACVWGSSCYRTNAQHLADFSHPDKDAAAREDEDEQLRVDGDAEYDPDEEKAGGGARKKAKTGAAASPSASPPRARGASASPPVVAAAAAAASSPVADGAAPAAGGAAAAGRAGSKVRNPCRWGEKCYNKDEAHLRRFTHPDPAASSAVPKSKEEYILDTNQSQVDLAQYYVFGGDDDLDIDQAAEMLAEDRNERRLSIQKWNENHQEDQVDLPDEADEALEIRTLAEKVATRPAEFFAGCASDEEDEVVKKPISTNSPRKTGHEEDDARTATVSEHARRNPAPAKPARGDSKLARVSSTAETERPGAAVAGPPRATRQSSRSGAVAPASSSAMGSAQTCPFLLPELLARAALTFDSNDGDVMCKKCKMDVADHRETR